MNQPIFDVVRTGARKTSALLWSALWALLCVCALALPSQAQVFVTWTNTSDGNSFEGDEGSKTYNFRINIGGTAGQTYRVSYRTVEGPVYDSSGASPAAHESKFWATNTANGVSLLDFQAKTATVDINANGNATVTVTVYGDTHYEDDEYFNVQLLNVFNVSGTPSGPTPVVNPANSQAEAVIRNDDGVPNLTVNTIADKGTGTLTLNYADSLIPELDSGGSNNLTYYVSADRINGKGSTGTFNLTTTPPTATASGTGLNQTFVYFTSNGTATAGSDYQATNATVVVPFNTITRPDDFPNPGGGTYEGNNSRVSRNLAANVQVTVPTIGDDIDEGNETVNVTLQAVANGLAQINPNGSIIAGTILDDDAPTANISDATVTEGDSGTVTATFPVTLDVPSTQQVQINYATSDFSALSVSHGSQVQNITLSGTPVSGTYTLAVNIIPGGLRTTAAIPYNADAAAIRAALIAAGVPGTDIISVTAPSAGSNAMEIVFRSQTNRTFAPMVFTPDAAFLDSGGNAVSGSVALTNSGLTLPANYLSTGGTLTFAPGETIKYIQVQVAGNTIPEGEDAVNRFLRYFVTIAANTNITNSSLGIQVGRATATGTISDNDNLSQLTFLQDVVTQEGNLDGNSRPQVTTADFVIQLQDQSGLDVSVQYATSDGTATGGSTGTVGSSSNPTDYKNTTGTIKFAPGETTKTISVQVFGDNFDEVDETFFVNLLNPTNATLLKTQARDLVIDDDGPVVSVSNANPVVEGNTGTTPVNFTLSLSAPSVQNIVVYVKTSDVTAVSTTGGTGLNSQDYQAVGVPTETPITFSPGETTKTVQVLVNGDVFNENDETFNLNVLRVDTNPNDPTNTVRPASIGVAQATGTIQNDDPLPTISVTDVSQNEGDAGQSNFDFTVALSAPTYRTVSFNYATANGTASLLDNDYLQRTGTLLFTAGETTKTVSIPVVGDVKKESDETFFVNISNIVNADFNSPVSDLQGQGTILNDDQAPAGVTITPTTLATSEGGAPKTFTAVLDRLPAADVIVRFTSSDTSEGLVSTGGGTPAASVALTFTPANYNVAQTVTVTGQDDSLPDGDIIYLINSENLTSTDPLYSGLNPVDVAVTNVDDEVPGFKVSKTSVQTSEVGVTDTFSVRLNVAPTSDVVIAVTSSNTAEGTVAPATLTFTTANFATPQTVTVTGVDDAVRDGDQAYQVVLAAATSTDARYNGLDPADVDATNIDNETPGIIVVPTQGLSTTEAGGTATFTIQLSSPPTSQVVIPLRSSDTTEGTVSPASVTFTSANFNVAQTVTVRGVNDTLDDGDIDYTIITDPAQTADVDYNSLNASDVAVTNIDDEVPGIVVAPTSLNVSENIGTTSFTVRLTTQPTADVTVPIVSAQATVADVTPNTLTFTPANFDVLQTVTVTVNDDLVDNDNRTFNITLGQATSLDANYAGLTQTLPITVVDNDTAGITVTPRTGLRVTEAAGTGRTTTFTVKLNSQPTSTVTIDLKSSDVSEGTVSPASLDFDDANWNAPQTVTITGVDDSVDDGNVNFDIITAPAVSSDAKYNALDASNVAVSNTDDDTTGIIVTPLNLKVSEKRTRAEFTVVLRSQPTARVTIPIVSSDTSEGTVLSSSLAFTIHNWNAPQRVIVVGANDFEDDGDVAFNVLVQPAVSTDATYSNLDATDVNVVTSDDDTAGISVTPSTKLTTSESGATATFAVKLLSQPTANVAIGLSSSDTTEGTVSPTSLNFTSANWNTAQTVTVTGVNDTTEDGHINYTVVTAAATSSDANYSGFDATDVSVVNLDNDDRSAPSVALTTPTNNASYRQFKTVKGTAKDAKDPAQFFVSGVGTVGVLFFRYDDPSTAANEAGYYDPATGQYLNKTYTEAARDINTHLIAAKTFSPNSGAFTVDLPGSTTSVAAGRYLVQGYAKDLSGNASFGSIVSFYVDPTAPPAPVITSPVNGATVTAATRIQGTAADNSGGSGISRVEVIVTRRANSANGLTTGYLQADGTFSATFSAATNRLAATGTANWTLNLPALPAATYDVKAYSFDNANNQSAPGTSSFTVTGGSNEFVGNATYLVSVPYMDDASITGTTTPLKAFTVPPVDPATGQRNFFLRRWNALTLQFEDLQNGATLRRGEGYLLTPAARSTGIRRPAQDATRKPLLNTIQEFQITLRSNPSVASDADNNGYNLIGDPFDPASFSSADWLNARVLTPSFQGTVAEAARQNPPILDSKIYSYNPDTNSYTVVSGSNLLAFRGYYVRTFQDGVQVNLKAVK